MEEESRKYNLAYFRTFEYLGQSELHFLIKGDILGVRLIKDEIKAVRQSTDNVSSLLQHIKNKLQKILQDSLEVKENEDKENNEIVVSLTQGSKHVNGNIILKTLPDNFMENIDLVLHIFDQKYSVIFNAPLIKHVQLPQILYAHFTIRPTKFQAFFTDNTKTLFYWYKSTDKITWEKIGEGFIYCVAESDVDNYLKLVCMPFNAAGIQGPIAEVVSETKVEVMGNLPHCPFETRHEFTLEKLKGLEFRVASYNILADRYATGSENYGYCPAKVLAIDYRKQLVLKELLGYNADIICLQEVDNKHYTTYFKEKFKEIGYGSIYHRKGNRISEGLTCIFNKSRYQQVESKHIVFSNEVQNNRVFSYLWKLIKRNTTLKALFLKQSTSFQVTVLKSKEANNRCLIVGNTHLFYHPAANHIRLLQVNMATSYLQMLRRRYTKGGTDVSVIFCGDFNSNPDNSVYPYMIQGTINPKHEDCLYIDERGEALLYHEFIFESSCGTPKYTNFTPGYKGCLDYIFIESNKLMIQQVVPLIEEEELNKHEGLPNPVFPSDHLALVVDLKFKVH